MANLGTMEDFWTKMLREHLDPETRTKCRRLSKRHHGWDLDFILSARMASFFMQIWDLTPVSRVAWKKLWRHYNGIFRLSVGDNVNFYDSDNMLYSVGTVQFQGHVKLTLGDNERDDKLVLHWSRLVGMLDDPLTSQEQSIYDVVDLKLVCYQEHSYWELKSRLFDGRLPKHNKCHFIRQLILNTNQEEVNTAFDAFNKMIEHRNLTRLVAFYRNQVLESLKESSSTGTVSTIIPGRNYPFLVSHLCPVLLEEDGIHCDISNPNGHKCTVCDQIVCMHAALLNLRFYR